MTTARLHLLMEEFSALRELVQRRPIIRDEIAARMASHGEGGEELRLIGDRLLQAADEPPGRGRERLIELLTTGVQTLNEGLATHLGGVASELTDVMTRLALDAAAVRGGRAPRGAAVRAADVERAMQLCGEVMSARRQVEAAMADASSALRRDVAAAEATALADSGLPLTAAQRERLGTAGIAVPTAGSARRASGALDPLYAPVVARLDAATRAQARTEAIRELLVLAGGDGAEVAAAIAAHAPASRVDTLTRALLRDLDEVTRTARTGFPGRARRHAERLVEATMLVFRAGGNAEDWHPLTIALGDDGHFMSGSHLDSPSFPAVQLEHDVTDAAKRHMGLPTPEAVGVGSAERNQLLAGLIEGPGGYVDQRRTFRDLPALGGEYPVRVQEDYLRELIHWAETMPDPPQAVTQRWPADWRTRAVAAFERALGAEPRAGWSSVDVTMQESALLGRHGGDGN